MGNNLYVSAILCDKKQVAGWRALYVSLSMKIKKNEELYILIYVEKGMERHTCWLYPFRQYLKGTCWILKWVGLGVEVGMEG